MVGSSTRASLEARRSQYFRLWYEECHKSNNWVRPQSGCTDFRAAHIPREHTQEYYVETPYADASNETANAQLWHDINVDAAMVALDDEYAWSHGLRTAQRFPWDTNKGIYLIHGFHNLHCMVRVSHFT